METSINNSLEHFAKKGFKNRWKRKHSIFGNMYFPIDWWYNHTKNSSYFTIL